MLKRFANSWELSKASLAVLKADKELIVFPLLSAIGVILVSAGFVLPVALTGQGERLADGPVGYLLAFLFYLATYFVIFFCNSALVGAALIRLRGGDPTVMDGLKIAFAHLGAIFGYALVAATVGMVLRVIQQRAGLLGRIVVAVVGLAWNIATFLVVPVLVTENLGPIASVKRSMTLLKKTWGESIVGNAGIGFVFGILIFLLILLAIPVGMLVAATHSAPLMIGVAVAFVAALVGLAIINATLSSIYTAAVYLYAAEGKAGHTFQSEMVQGAFRPK